MRRASLRRLVLGGIAVLAIVSAAALAPRGDSASLATQNTWAGVWTSDFGDLTSLFEGFHDTTTGPKREASS